MRASLPPGGNRPLRICLVVPYDLGPEGGGVKQHALHLADALQRLGDHVTIIGPTSLPLQDPRLHGFRGVVNIPMNGSDNMLGIFVSPRKVQRYFERNRFDLIHFHEPLSPVMSLWVARATRDTPHVATFHAYAESNAWAAARRLWGRFMLGSVKRAIAVSPPAARYAAAAWPMPMTIIPNGVPTRIFKPSGHKASRKPGDPVRLLFVGRLGDTRKGARYLFEAYAALKKQNVPVTLDVVGELGGAPVPPKLPALVYHGEVPLEALASHYQACDVFVAPSTGQESFGIILLEAMASGKALVCSSIDGYREMAKTTGARFVPPADPVALAAALSDLAMATPEVRAAMGQTNLEFVQNFDWDNLVHKVREEYFQAMAAV